MQASEIVAPRTQPASRGPWEILDWAGQCFGERLVVASALGLQSVAAMEMLHALGHRPKVVLLDTDLLFPETYALRIRLQHRYGWAIESVRPELDLDEQAAIHGPALWERDPDACCAIRKVAPLARVLDGYDAWIAGLRRDQSATRAGVESVAWDDSHGLLKICPFAHWTGREVREFLESRDVPTNPLLRQGFRSIGCQPCTRKSEGDDERSGRWAGTTKTECGIHAPTPRSSP